MRGKIGRERKKRIQKERMKRIQKERMKRIQREKWMGRERMGMTTVHSDHNISIGSLVMFGLPASTIISCICYC